MESEKENLSYREGKHRLKSIRWMLFWIAAIQMLAILAFAMLESVFSLSFPAWIQMLIIELAAYLKAAVELYRADLDNLAAKRH